MTTDATSYAERIEKLWWGEGCNWKLCYEDAHFGADAWWNVYLEWTSDTGNPHQCDWVTYTWQFYDHDAEVALREALGWLEELAPWEKCGECDGQGEWNGKPCVYCKQTGLAHA